MRLLAFAVISAFAIAATATDASAARHHKKHKYRSYNYERVYGYRDARRGYDSGYYEHWADKLPFGSRRWFDQMEREGRFGGRHP